MTCPDCGARTTVTRGPDGKRAHRCQNTADCGGWYRDGGDGDLAPVDRGGVVETKSTTDEEE